ncbi:Hypothetical predicted protein [Paramuricea clavata]|uniref:Uncharacterized protein n=1 Tax=Paramuricea clavata TaxID=317549 RepID=A0A7D9D7X2_PARCT|nr:Hypothetical predicted protein [Paramuricea clavata]
MDDIDWEYLDSWEWERKKNLDIIRKSEAFKLFNERSCGEINAWKNWCEMIEPLDKNKLDISHWLYTARYWCSDGEEPLLDDCINFMYVSNKCQVTNNITQAWQQIVFINNCFSKMYIHYNNEGWHGAFSTADKTYN